MDLADVRDHVDEQCEFPISHEDLMAEVGELTIEAPTTATESLGAVLERTSDHRYRSLDALYRTVKGNVGEAFVGPKNYDDRAGARTGPQDRHPTTD